MPLRRKQKIRHRVFLAILAFLFLVAGITLFKAGKLVNISWQLVTNKNIDLKVTKDKKVNILLLGVGGGTHEGPDLTDTIMFASIDPANKKVTLVSIPRDLWIPELKQKINYAYVAGEEKQKGGGLVLTKAVVGKVLGQQADYAVKIDFSGFVKAIDMAGGLDINVDNAFDDYAYPIEGKEEDTCGHTNQEVADLTQQIATESSTNSDSFPCRYEHLHFDKGLQHMDGTTALKYVRSRHALGTEGTDFARSKRQEKVITAFKDKIFSAGTLLNPVKLISIVNVLKGSIDMDIKEDEYDDFIRLAEKLKGAKINSVVLDMGDDLTNRPGLLEDPGSTADYNGLWVVIPRTGSGNYMEIQNYINCELKGGKCVVSTQPAM